jgi:hypothetical protein
MRKKNRKLIRILYYPKKNYRSAVRILKLLTQRDLCTTQSIAESIKTANNHHGTKLQMEYLASLGYCEDYGIVSNSNHKCDYCKQTDRYVVKKEYLDSAVARLEENPKLKNENKNKPDFDPSRYFNCKENCVLGRLVSLRCKGCCKYVESHNDEEYKVYQDRLWALTENGLYIFLVLLKGQQWYNFIKKHVANKVFELINVLIQSQEKHIVQRLVQKLQDEMKNTPNLEKIVSLWYDETFNEVMISKYSDKIHLPIIEYKKKHYWDYQIKLVHKRSS